VKDKERNTSPLRFAAAIAV